MATIDWLLVACLNGAIIIYALYQSRRADTSNEWFLGGRSLPWWVVGVSAFATAIDSSDIVADAGGVYSLGISYFVTNWVGTVVGWFLLAHCIALPMYRAGMYTNSEYLEVRFGPVARILSSLVQVQYRTMVMANISTTLFLSFAVVGGLGNAAWWVVAAVMLAALSYTIWGGSNSVAWTDAVQSVVMIAASLILFFVVWNAVGGWSGLHDKLMAADTALPDRLLHVGGEKVDVVRLPRATESEIAAHLLLGGDYDGDERTITRRTPAWLACISFVLVGMAYAIVNHEQSMRLFAARSAWDMKMSVAVAGLLLIGITYFNLMMGIFGRALYPSHGALPVDDALRQTADAVYPILIRDFTVAGWKGIVVAGLLAAAISTYAGMGAAMSALLTRDVYARLIARDRDDHHYVVVGRWMTLAIVMGSFVYVPFLLKQGMMAFYLNLVSAFVAPLLTVYLMGVFTRVHRTSGTIGLLVGMTYGVWRMAAERLAIDYGLLTMPAAMMNSYAAYPISVLITAGTMFILSILRGWERPGETLHRMERGWRPNCPAAVAQSPPVEREPSDAAPIIFGLAVVAFGIYLGFVAFW